MSHVLLVLELSPFKTGLLQTAHRHTLKRLIYENHGAVRH